MKKFKWIVIASLLFATACAPVFREEIMRNSTLNPSLSELNAAPAGFEGKMFILGGKIISLNNSEEGSLLEAMYIPVDFRGYIDYTENYKGRFMAFMPKDKGLLDPLMFRPDRDVTIAGIYRGVKSSFSYFEIVQIILWDEVHYYFGPVFYAPYPYYWYWRDPWPWPRYHFYYYMR